MNVKRSKLLPFGQWTGICLLGLIVLVTVQSLWAFRDPSSGDSLSLSFASMSSPSPLRAGFARVNGYNYASTRANPQHREQVSQAAVYTLGEAKASVEWVDVSTPLLARLTNGGAKAEWPGGCSGVVVNRTNGDVTIKVVGLGLWRSSDQGGSWTRIDDKTVGGRDETGWASSVDQDSPGRLASFSLDGPAGWTADGKRWTRFADLGRNWDYGSVDWSISEPQNIIAAKHETTPPGEVYVTSDGGVSWDLLSIRVSGDRGKISMVGAMGGRSFIYANGDGIHRSTDAGATWAKVSPLHPQTRIPVLFRGLNYLGTTNGLIVSKDKGASWQIQGAPIDVWQGPFFGRNEREMLVVGKAGAFLTRNGGESWKQVADLKTKEAGFHFTPNWFGCYAWDPINNLLYASAMGNPVFRTKLPEVP